jgi:hypothetical protein
MVAVLSLSRRRAINDLNVIVHDIVLQIIYTTVFRVKWWNKRTLRLFNRLTRKTLRLFNRLTRKTLRLFNRLTRKTLRLFNRLTRKTVVWLLPGHKFHICFTFRVQYKQMNKIKVHAFLYIIFWVLNYWLKKF